MEDPTVPTTKPLNEIKTAVGIDVGLKGIILNNKDTSAERYKKNIFLQHNFKNSEDCSN